MPKADTSTDDAIRRVGYRLLADGFKTHLEVWANAMRNGIECDPSTVWRALMAKPELFERRAFDGYFRTKTP